MSYTKLQETETPEHVNKICAGIDVHRDFACVTVIERRVIEDVELDYKVFLTNKQQMIALRSWLLSFGVSTVGIESTGKYWFSVFLALDGHIKLNLYNARHIKNIPGKKTDKSDSHWIAQATLNDNIRPSFIPEAQIRDSRLLSRYRKSLVQERTRIRQQTHSLLECCGVKISGVASDLFGVSGKNLMRLIASGESYDETTVGKLVHRQLRGKVPALMIALDGYVRPIHRSLLIDLLRSDEEFSRQIALVEVQLSKLLLDTPEKIAIHTRVCELPGFANVSTLILLSETGFDLASFPSEKHFASWAGLCPGSHESAGKSKSGRIQARQKYLRGLFVEIALVAICRKKTYLREKYFYLKIRIGSNKAVIAIAHKLAKAVYMTIKDGKQYYELTDQYVSLSQMAKDKKTIEKISSRLGKETVQALIDNCNSPISTE